MKDILNKHKVLLSLPDNQIKLDNIGAITCYHNIPITANIKLPDLKDLQLKHCNATLTIPMTFVSDGSIQTVTEVKESDRFTKHEEATCVAITFVNDVMINLAKSKTQKKEMT